MLNFELLNRLKNKQLRHLELLVALVSMLVAQSFLTPEDTVQRMLINALFFIVVLSAIRTLSPSLFRLRIAIALGIVAYGLSWVSEIYPSTMIVAVIDIAFITIFSLLAFSLAENVFSDGEVNTERIIGAVSIFFLFGLAWAFIYALIEIAVPGSFKFSETATIDSTHSGYLGEFLYFSNVTLTTLGYGDVVPVSQPARMVATIQAMVGQLYIAIIIARLVGLQVSQRRRLSDDG